MSGTSLSVEEAGLRLGELVERARRLRESTLLTKDGTAAARLVPLPPELSIAGVLAEAFATRPQLGVEEAEAWAKDLEEARKQVKTTMLPHSSPSTCCML